MAMIPLPEAQSVVLEGTPVLDPREVDFTEASGGSLNTHRPASFSTNGFNGAYGICLATRFTTPHIEVF